MRWTAFLLLLFLPDSGAAIAAEASGAATPLLLDLCERLGEDGGDLGALYRCPGPAGTDAYVAGGAGRSGVSLGTPEGAFETFGPPNTLAGTMEWRVADGRPFAGIVRFRLAGAAGAPDGGEVLVVLKVGTDAAPGCRVAVVDATANPDARVLARQSADGWTRAFRCGRDRTEVVGTVSDWMTETILPALR